jgi:hypothetical protein
LRIHLSYGKSGLDIDLPEAWDVDVIEPRFVGGLPDPTNVLQEILREPIQLKADVYVYSENLTDKQIHSALLFPCRDISTTVGTLLER